MNIIKRLKQLVYKLLYNETPMVKKCNDLIAEIDERYKEFINIFLKKDRREISEEEMLSQMREIINKMDDLTLREYNQMWKMYSQTNCGWDSYQASQIVHNLIIEKMYPIKE